jgi:hypothetical protein
VQVYAEIGLRKAVVVPVWEMAASEGVPSSSLSDHKAWLVEAVAVGFEFQQCFESSRQRDPGEPVHAGEEQLEERPHPIEVLAGLQHHSGTPAGERLVASGHCAG